MKFSIPLLVIVALATNAQAGPVTFDQASLFVDAFADVDGASVVDFAGLQTPPADIAIELPLNASVSQNGQAFADSLIDSVGHNFFLDVTTEAFSDVGESAEAIAVAEFSGEFLANPGTLQFTAQFDVLNELLFGGAADFSAANLFVEIITDGLVVFNGFLTNTGELTHRFRHEVFSSTFVNLLVSSKSAASTPGANAFNAASATFAIRTIPEPSTIFLLGAAFIGLQSRRVS